jgi:hypothetical protein
MIFEVGYLNITIPVDPSKGQRYIEPTRGDDIDNLYNMTTWMEDYVDPTTDGALSWQSVSSCASDSEASIEHWRQRMHEVSTRRCARMTRFVL